MSNGRPRLAFLAGASGINSAPRPANAVRDIGVLAACAIHGHMRRSICDDCGIRHIAVCGALDDNELRALEAIMSHRRLDAGQSLVLEEDAADYAFNVIAGGLKLYKSMRDGRTQITGYLLSGDFLGLPFRGGHVVSAEATAATELCQFPRDPLKRVFDRYEKLQERFLTAAHDEIIAVQEHMLLLGRKTAIERLSTFLVRLLQRTERARGTIEPLHIPLHRNDIADYLGLTIETVSRNFTELRKKKLIRLEKADQVVITDRVRLEAIANVS